MDINQIKKLYYNKSTKLQQMENNEQQERKQFSVPTKDELIQQIKDLDEDIQHVTLNLIKCDFNATEKDIEKTFSDFKFIKVKNYNPGSFEVVFEMRIDAINFIRNHCDKKILNRRFFVKMGRQQKQVIENWTGVGNAQRQFRGPRQNNNRNQQQGGQHRTKKPQQSKTEHKTQGEKATQQTKPESQVKPQIKKEVKELTTTQEPVKKQGKIIPKTETHYKKPQHKKPHHETQKKTEGHEKKAEGHVKKEEHHVKKEHHTKKEEVHVPKKEGEKKQAPKKTEQPKEEKKQATQKVPQKVEKKEEDDGWITVPSKNQKRR